MDGYEDENPFETDADRISSETSSTSKVNLSEPPSPPTRLLSAATSPSCQFPSFGSHRPATSSFKNDFCCTRDQALHSGEDVEILVHPFII
jgi:sorting nexin-4